MNKFNKQTSLNVEHFVFQHVIQIHLNIPSINMNGWKMQQRFLPI